VSYPREVQHGLGKLGLTKLESRAALFTTIYSAARDLANRFYGVNLPDEMLPAAVCNTDDSLSSKVAEKNINANIPLPWSNSQLAKQMRVAFFLSVLAGELCTHIFQPTYLIKDTTFLDKTLVALSVKDPDLEAHFRSVLLMVDTKLGNTDESGDEACVKIAVNNVVNKVFNRASMLVDEAKHDAFKGELRLFCKRTCVVWRTIQKLEDRFVADLGLAQASRLRKWKPLIFEDPDQTVTSSSKSRANSSAPKNQGSSKSQGSSKNPPPLPAPQLNGIAPVNLAEAIAVWPVFYNLSDGRETCAPGFVLPPALKMEARAEETAILERLDSETPILNSGPARALRGEKRRRSSVLTVNGSQTGSFLSERSGGGRKGV
jgi:hypothetical protein